MKIVIEFDPEKQSATMEFDKEEVKTWEYMVAILGMAMSQAEFNRDLARQQAFVQHQREAAQAASLREKLKL